MAVVAEEERRMISARTKAALAAAKRRGVKLGGDRGVVPSRKARRLAIEAVQARADAKAANLARSPDVMTAVATHPTRETLHD